MRTLVSSGSLNPKLRVYGPDGTLLGEEVTEQDLLVVGCTLGGAGTYHVLLGAKDGSSTGSYSLFLQSANAPLGSAPLDYGDTSIGMIELAPEMDAFSVESHSAGERMLLRMVVTAGFLDPRMRVHGPDGSTVCEDGTILTLLEVECQLDATGRYTILVGDRSGTRTGSYNLYMQRTSDAVGATPVVYGDTVAGSVGFAAEMDGLTFNGIQGDEIQVRMSVVSGLGLDPDVRIYGPDGTSLCSASTIAIVLLLDCALVESGGHTILVGDSGGADTGAYSLNLCLAVLCLPLDTDEHACTDEAERGPKEDAVSGGGRNPFYFWDFFSVWAGSPPKRDATVAITDIGAIVARFGAEVEPPPTEQEALAEALTPPPPAPAYHASFDRGGTAPGQNLWNQLPPDGNISIIDVGAAVAQFGHSCV